MCLGLLASCAVNPLTGKKTLNLVPNEQLFQHHFSSMEHFLKRK
jgi:hypothetical protein